MPSCHKCGVAVKKDAKFCDYCAKFTEKDALDLVASAFGWEKK
jgi:RNA polymerase subunit RPABC4/transcription elongation factor Spt4